MATILDRILASKREEVAAAHAAVPESTLRSQVAGLPPPRRFEQALRDKRAAGQPAVIAEIKRASPSQGVMKADIDPAAIAGGYERAGAACLSVLTDGPYFKGAPADLKAARAACGLPVLRKDFMVDPYQVWEARAMEADCILLIAGAVPVAAMQEMAGIAQELGMAVLVESHRSDELDAALQVPTPLIGINNRDLATFSTDLSISIELSRRVPPDRLVIAESGVSSAADVLRLSAAGIHAFLVGGAFMSAPDPGAELMRIFTR
ncbi:MAG: indole-3-glycerol phosphate synthase TrpC [Betaproteobacteria bacterium]|nr:indole-3-glycerol phosphate synthase TrpC [Betaproteobacteria bacterium]